MDLNQFIDLSSKVIIPIVNILIMIVSLICGYFVGLIKERNFIKWQENRQALQIAYGCSDIYLARIKTDEPISDLLFEQLNQLKYKHIFNIEDKNLFNKLHNILEIPVYDNANKKYNPELKQEFIKALENILPLLKQALK